MNMKKILPIVMMATVPVMGMAQNKTGLYEKNFDKNVRPQDDFYQFATGGWQKNNPLPAAYSRFGSFDQLQEDNNKRINTILTSLQKKKFKAGTIEQKLSDFYKQALDQNSRNKAGISPVKPLLDEQIYEDLMNLLDEAMIEAYKKGKRRADDARYNNVPRK